jgi:LCT (Lysosomal Cystine Transporter) family transporter
MWWNTAVVQEWQSTHHSSERAVHLNDVIFALHCTLMTAIMATQALLLDRGGQQVSKLCIAGLAAAVGMVAVYALVLLSCQTLASSCSVPVSILGLIYIVGSIKIGVTLVKYVPQVLLNHTRKSTQGWSVLNVTLDLAGGLMSLGQVLLVCSVSGDWSRVTGNPITIGLALISIAFDLVFTAQHYVWYGDGVAYLPGAMQEVQLPQVFGAAQPSAAVVWPAGPQQSQLPGGPAAGLAHEPWGQPVKVNGQTLGQTKGCHTTLSASPEASAGTAAAAPSPTEAQWPAAAAAPDGEADPCGDDDGGGEEPTTQLLGKQQERSDART